MVTVSMYIETDSDNEDEEVNIKVPVHEPSQPPACWPKRMKARPEIQRAFDSWYRIHQQRFLIKLVFLSRTDRRLIFSFAGITSVLSVTLTEYDLSVRVTWFGDTWELLKWWNASPKREGHGYICALCQPSEVFATRCAVWEDHLFEPLLDWVNKSLLVATELHLEGVTNDITYAKLC
jgi:hypothetical protein